MADLLDLATIGTGAVVAPAGHGKTYTIGQTVEAHPELSILVLTHTHAGIAALNRQIGRRAIRQLRLETIASFSLKIARSFPGRGNWDETEEVNHDAAHASALQALDSPTVLRVITNTFDLVIVDEYQDCSVVQAYIIDALATRVPTVVVGDPMQGIYDFGSQPAINWTGSTTSLPLKATLSTPHRWTNTNPRLGEWLSAARDSLEVGEKPTIDHSIVEIADLDKKPTQGGLHHFLKNSTPTAIITPNSAVVASIPKIARSHQGRVRVAEAADFTELRKVAQKFDGLEPTESLVALIDFSALCATGIITGPVRTLKEKLTKRNQASRSTHPVVMGAKSYLEVITPLAAVEFLRILINHGKSVYRPELFSLMIRGLNLKSLHPERTLDECVVSALEQRNHTISTSTYGAVVGSTLRLKGLEFDTVVILDPREIPSAKHLYVALTRATRRLVIASSPNT